MNFWSLSINSSERPQAGSIRSKATMEGAPKSDSHLMADIAQLELGQSETTTEHIDAAAAEAFEAQEITTDPLLVYSTYTTERHPQAPHDVKWRPALSRVETGAVPKSSALLPTPLQPYFVQYRQAEPSLTPTAPLPLQNFPNALPRAPLPPQPLFTNQQLRHPPPPQHAGPNYPQPRHALQQKDRHNSGTRPDVRDQVLFEALLFYTIFVLASTLQRRIHFQHLTPRMPSPPGRGDETSRANKSRTAGNHGWRIGLPLC